MTDTSTPGKKTDWASPQLLAKVAQRQRAEKRFRRLGLSAIVIALAMLATLLFSIAGKGYSAFYQTRLVMDVTFSEAVIDPKGTRNEDDLRAAGYGGIVRDTLRETFPDVKSRKDLRELFALVSKGAPMQLRDMVLDNPDLIGQTVPVDFIAGDDIDMFNKGFIPRDVPEGDRRVKDMEIAWFDQLDAVGAVKMVFNSTFFTSGDSREPELAGIWGAISGSFYTLIVTFLISFPIGVMSAIYLEEFAPQNKFTDLIEVNINNLAAVPSIVFGLLGLALFLNVAHLPRSAPLVGGLTLALMTLPTIIIASRAAIRAVPDSIREAALGLGASKQQTAFHHVLPLSMPGILTGTIIGLSQALGETAPLLMIGMVAFIVDIPGGFTDAATVLPVQIFLWADSPERAFVEKTSGAILVLLGFLIFMNALAVLLRKKFERRW
ncbi:phosphate ABC transporter permease PstA [Sneathiella chinensis]|uniref:Phosphate transport system permease protein PstA n=1 Tax=Sneathiella chinensis TaxID=349750 RepID=A0ABQ5U338_9PROT|nr:phosphate ABC transporter permease PstA [Sneathiella chinensis]GLQ06574.1 phosphate transport system permease protein PstA [Sneathiella chinensis]